MANLNEIRSIIAQADKRNRRLNNALRALRAEGVELPDQARAVRNMAADIDGEAYGTITALLDIERQNVREAFGGI